MLRTLPPAVQLGWDTQGTAVPAAWVGSPLAQASGAAGLGPSATGLGHYSNTGWTCLPGSWPLWWAGQAANGS